MHCKQILAHMIPCGPSVQKEVQPRMAKISANYEVVFIMDGRLPEEQVAALTEKFKTLVEQNSTAMEVEEWGKRRLAYAIDYKTEGYYVYVAFNGASELPKELSRNLGINENVIRSQIVKLLEKKSSVKPRPVRVAPVSEETPAEAAPAEQA